jgi:hypothetical protein
MKSHGSFQKRFRRSGVVVGRPIAAGRPGQSATAGWQPALRNHRQERSCLPGTPATSRPRSRPVRYQASVPNLRPTVGRPPCALCARPSTWAEGERRTHRAIVPRSSSRGPRCGSKLREERAISGQVRVEIDSRYFRPTEVDLLIGDPSKAREKLGWRHPVSFDELVSEMVDADLALMRRRAEFGTAHPESEQRLREVW